MKDAEDEAFDDIAKKQGHWGGGYQAKKAMAADKLQEPAQEPVACVMGTYGGMFVVGPLNSAVVLPTGMALYSTPQHTATWVGLTDEEIKEIVGPYGDMPIKGYTRKLFDQIEAKLRSKNNA
jgi:hypothetical protein